MNAIDLNCITKGGSTLITGEVTKQGYSTSLYLSDYLLNNLVLSLRYNQILIVLLDRTEKCVLKFLKNSLLKGNNIKFITNIKHFLSIIDNNYDDIDTVIDSNFEIFRNKKNISKTTACIVYSGDALFQYYSHNIINIKKFIVKCNKHFQVVVIPLLKSLYSTIELSKLSTFFINHIELNVNEKQLLDNNVIATAKITHVATSLSIYYIPSWVSQYHSLSFIIIPIWILAKRPRAFR